MKTQSIGAWFALICGVSLTMAGGSFAGEAEGRIPTPTDLRECLDECEYQYGREIEACSRKRDPTKRQECYAKANDRYAQCKSTCREKYPEK